MRRPIRVLLTRGHHATPWNLQVWEGLPSRFEVSVATTRTNKFDLEGVAIGRVKARALRDLLPRGQIADAVAGVLGDRFIHGDGAFAAADIVHAEEISFWFGAEAARFKQRHGFRLVSTVWETIPLLRVYRNLHARSYRHQVLSATDLFLATTERACNALLLEGVPPEQIKVWSPGIDVRRFRVKPLEQPGEHVILSPGRLVWEKGHQDVLRAVAALERGLVARPAGVRLRVLLVGSGPERDRLLTYARELGIADLVELSSATHADMPEVYARASCMVLASLPSATGGFYPGDVPRTFWEEQFGMVLAEAMAAGLPIITTTSGAIPEVVGDAAEYVAPGDWPGLAETLARGVLARPPGQRIAHAPERVAHYSSDAAAARLAAVYDELMERVPILTSPG